MPDNLRPMNDQIVITSNRLKEAQTEYQNLSARLAQAPENIYIKSELGNLARYITGLKQAQVEQQRLMGVSTPDNYSNEEKREATRKAEEEARKKQVSARDDLLKRLATPAEKLSEELRTQKALLGDLFTPEIEQRIRSNIIKPTKEAKQAVDEFAKVYGQVTAKSAGLDAGFGSDLETLYKGYQKGRIGIDEYRSAVEKLIGQQQFAKDAAQAAAKAQEDEARAYEAGLKPLEDAARSAQDRVTKMLEEQDAAKLAADQNISLARAVELTAIARLKEAQAIEMSHGAGMDDARVLALQKEIDARQRIADMIGNNDAKAALEKMRKEESDAWEKTWGQVAQSFTDALMQGGQSVKQYLVNLFKTMVLRPIIDPIAKSFGGTLASFFGGSGSAFAGQGGGGGGGMFSLGDLFNPSKIFSSLSDSIAFAADGAGQWLVNNTSGYLNQLGGQLMGNAGTLGTLGGYAGGAMAGLALGKGISGGYSAVGKSGNAAVNVGTVAGMIFGGPIGGAIGGAIGGLGNRAFGRKLKDSGIEGTFGADGGFEGQQYQFYKGGWFRSNKTKYSALDAGTQDALSEQFTALRTGVADMAKSLGQDATAIESFTKKIKVSFQGLSEADIQKRLAETFTGLGNDMAEMLLGTYEYVTTTTTRLFKESSTTTAKWIAGEFVRDGETALEALTRLSGSLLAVNGAFDTLGQTLMQTSLAGGDTASKLIDAFGGMDQFGSATTAYYQAMYSQQEQLDTAQRQIGAAISDLGLSMPDSIAGFRALVEAQDLSTESGRAAYAALIQMAPAFASVANAASAATAQIAQERASLETQLLTLQGNTAALRERELAALDPSNRALQEQIWALESQKAAAEQAAQAQSAAASAAQESAARARSATQSVFDALDSAIKKLYGSVEQTTAMSAAQANDYINQAIANKAKTGSYGDTEKLTAAVEAAMAGLDSQQYASAFDADRERLRLAGLLQQLRGTAKIPSTAAAKSAKSTKSATASAPGTQPVSSLPLPDVPTPRVTAPMPVPEVTIPRNYLPTPAPNISVSAEKAISTALETLNKNMMELVARTAASALQMRRTADAVNGNPERPMLVETAA